MSALHIEDVAADLGGRSVLTGVNLTVHSGELVGLIGPNGAGKTTLIRAVLGLIRRHRGTVSLDGKPLPPGVPVGKAVRRSKYRTLPRVGYVPQRHEFAWDFPASVEDVVMSGRAGDLGLFRRPKEADWHAVVDALERVEMMGLRHRPVGELSGGQRQRVLVARALALAPSVLLLDEPFAALDVPTQELLSELFASLARDGHAVLMTTHDLLGAIATCDRLALINRRILASARPAELRDPAPWMETFGVGPTSPLLRILELVPTAEVLQVAENGATASSKDRSVTTKDSATSVGAEGKL